MSQPNTDRGQWLERHRPYLHLLVRTHRNQHHPAKLDASDVVQQTLLDAFAKREQFRGSTDAELAAWLRQILKHNLHHLQGRKLAEVALEIDRSEPAVAGLLFRGLRSLHTLLGERQQ